MYCLFNEKRKKPLYWATAHLILINGEKETLTKDDIYYTDFIWKSEDIIIEILNKHKFVQCDSGKYINVNQIKEFTLEKKGINNDQPK